MLQTLSLISKINKFKELNNLILNKKIFVFKSNHIFLDLNLINETNINYIFFKKNIIALELNHNIYNFDKKTNFYNFLKFFQETLILNHYKELSFKKHYSNFDLNMIYTLSLINSDTKSIFDDDAYSVINIRRPYRSTNSVLLKKTNLIDLILKKYIETNLNTRVSINFDKYGIAFVKKKNIFLRVLRRRLRRLRRMLRASDISLRNFIRITFIFLCTKDIDIFAKVLLKIMNSMHYKNHRKFLYYLKLFISKSMNYYFETLKFEGFFFYLSGKISGGGNSKKKHYVVKCGKYSLTNKMLKLKFKKGLIHTKTGVLGYKFIISYK
jgi:hypothetical protein